MSNLQNIAHITCAALQALHAVNATPETIKQAETVLSEVKTSLDALSAIDLAEHLLIGLIDKTRNEPTTSEIQFAFHLLDEHLLHASIPWIRFSDDQRTRVRNLSTQLISIAHTLPSYATSRSIDLLVDVAIREWPQRWPDLLPHLMQQVPPLFACRVLLGLSDQVHLFADTIVPSRRQELRRALAVSLPDTLKFVIQSANVSHEQGEVEVLTISLECLRSFLAWAALPNIFASGVPLACIRLLSNPLVRDASLSVITTLASRKVASSWEKADGTDDGLEFHPEIAFRELFGTILQYMSDEQIFIEMGTFYLIRPTNLLPKARTAYDRNQRNLESLSVEDHEFRIKFFEMLTELGNSHFVSSFLYSQRTGPFQLNSEAEASAAAYLDIMICALTYPSVAVQILVISFFTSTLNTILKKEDHGTAKKVILYLVNGVLNAISCSSIQFPQNEERIFFDELDETIDPTNSGVFDSIVPRATALISIAAKVHPEKALNVSLSRLLQLLSRIPSVNSSIQVAKCKTNQHSCLPKQYIEANMHDHEWVFSSIVGDDSSVWVACVEAACSFTDAVTSTLVSSNQLNDNQPIWNQFRKAFDCFLQIPSSEFSLLKAYALRTFVALYRKDMDALIKGTETLVSIAFNAQIETEVRQKACSFLAVVLRRLSTANVKAINNFATPLCQKARECLGNDSFRISEKCNVLEAAFACVMQMDIIDEQSALVEAVLHPVLQDVQASSSSNIFTSPESFISFLKSGTSKEVDRLCESFVMVESVTHLLTKSIAKSQTPLRTPGILSRSVAPMSVDVVSILITILHAIYNTKSFSANGLDASLKNISYPTNKEIVQLLNIRNNEQTITQPLTTTTAFRDEKKIDVITEEQRCGEILGAYGVRSQDSENFRIREIIRQLRRCAYEIARASILSGVTNSADHLVKLIEAITFDYKFIEAHHLLAIVSRILTPLLSYPVLMLNDSYLAYISQSKLPQVLELIRQHIDAFQNDKLILTESPTLDIAREHSRRAMPRAVADMLTAMFPRLEQSPNGAGTKPTSIYIPAALKTGRLGQELQLLWRAVCNPTPGQADNNAARVGFTLISSAAEMAPESEYQIFAPLLEGSLRVSVLNNAKLAEDTPADLAVRAMLSILRKWPKLSEFTLRETFGSRHPQVNQWVTECISAIAGAGQLTSKSKKHRQLIKTLVQKIADLEGTSSQSRRKVHSLPEKLIAKNPTRSKRNYRPELEDVELGEFALESLFGEGDPL